MNSLEKLNSIKIEAVKITELIRQSLPATEKFAVFQLFQTFLSEFTLAILATSGRDFTVEESVAYEDMLDDLFTTQVDQAMELTDKALGLAERALDELKQSKTTTVKIGSGGACCK